MATRKKITAVEIPEAGMEAETADQALGVKRVLLLDAYGGRYAACGNCHARLVNVEERVKCLYCWYCGKKVRWP